MSEYQSKAAGSVSSNKPMSSPVPPDSIITYLALDDAKRVTMSGTTGDWILFKDFGFTFPADLYATQIGIYVNGSCPAKLCYFKIWSTKDGVDFLELLTENSQFLATAEQTSALESHSNEWTNTYSTSEVNSSSFGVAMVFDTSSFSISLDQVLVGVTMASPSNPSITQTMYRFPQTIKDL